MTNIKEKVQKQAQTRAQYAHDSLAYAQIKFAEAQAELEKADKEYNDALQSCKDEGVIFEPLKWEE